MVQYREQVRALAARERTSLLAYDWLGCGGSDKPRTWSAYNSLELAADVEAALELLRDGDAKIPVLIIAHSFGCSLTVDMLQAKPHLLPAALVLISTSAGDEVMSQLGIFALPELALLAIQPLLTAGFRKQAYHPETPQDIVAQGDAISAANNMFMCKAHYWQMKWASADALASMRCPVLAIHGEGDLVIPCERGRQWAARLSGPSAFLSVGRASHMVMLERPSIVNSALLTMASNLESSRQALAGL
ncbi:Alpha/Beta hydrolase protein [Pavlovales sp. CCMP2436]|nr:Alpha/Beta hydrolase protein [Pavlovales sp. CCMP2436]|mmetsp:Transcript_37224/g.92621  ORF Transcript_37224/g.92621 Transcript_37224/m.92621 type:complete len:247 (+) Transcript_37224:1341-2081(+)